jgi:hypothetical protein
METRILYRCTRKVNELDRERRVFRVEFTPDKPGCLSDTPFVITDATRDQFEYFEVGRFYSMLLTFFEVET